VIAEQHRKAEPFRVVLTFLWRQWRRHPQLLAVLLVGMTTATIADVLVPIFAGELVDALAQADATGREAALGSALDALAILALLGLAVLGGRILGILGLIALTLRVMSEVGSEAFQRVQRFSADWHADTFAGSTVRRVSRGM